MSKQRWKDSLLEPRFSKHWPDGVRLSKACTYIAGAITLKHKDHFQFHASDHDMHLAWAGWLIRAERRKCDAEYGQPSDKCWHIYMGQSVPLGELLWHAIGKVERAALSHPDNLPERSYHLREAEAYLREHWKRQQAGGAS